MKEGMYVKGFFSVTKHFMTIENIMKGTNEYVMNTINAIEPCISYETIFNVTTYVCFFFERKNLR